MGLPLCTTEKLPELPDYASLERNASLPASLTLADIMEGIVPNEAFAAGQLTLPESVVGIHQSGAIPMSAAAFRDFKRRTSLRLLTSSVSLDTKSLEETKGYRIRTAYRLVSALARVTGVLANSQMLSSALSPRPEVQRHDPFRIPHPTPVSRGIAGTTVVQSILHAINANPHAATFAIDGIETPSTGLTYLPPPIPDRYYIEAGITTFAEIDRLRRTSTPPPGYNPEDDVGLCLWLDAMEYLSYFLGVNKGTEKEPQAGLYGTLGLFSAKTARLCWPCADDLLNYEVELLFYVGDFVTRRVRASLDKTPEQLVQDEFGYTRSEAVLLCNTAGAFMSYVYSDDPETMRSKEIQRLETIADRCVDAGDPRAEFAVTKHKHMMMGLTRMAEGESMSAYRDMAIEAVSEKRADEEPLLLE